MIGNPMRMYDFDPIEIIESFQNFGRDDVDDMNLEQLKEEYKRALTEKKDLEEELGDVENKKPTDYALRERIENTQKYIDKVKKMLNGKVSDEEMDRIEKSIQSRYDKKKDNEDDED